MSAPMDVLRDPAAARAWTRSAHSAGRTVALVPTMGALHDGHLALVARARELADDVVVSIFVNPLQFDRRDDFDAYPRPLDDDLTHCRTLGVAAVYAPTAAVMYPAGYDTRVEPGDLAARFEGEHRPGHFTGVVTVVTKLLTAVGPDIAVFGRKDAQQLALVRRTTADLDLGVRIVDVPTVREPDGLALSSRNVRLGPAERRAAGAIPRALATGRRVAAGATTSATDVTDSVRAALGGSGLEVEYVAVVDRRTFAPVEALGPGIDDGPVGEGQLLIVFAGWSGGVRLIDNVPLTGPDDVDVLLADGG